MTESERVRSWLEYGDHDWNTAKQMSTTNPPPLEIIAFHYEQAAEKYLKACLVANSLPLPKIHDLLHLNRLLAPAFPQISELEAECDRLSDFGTITRYPSETIVLDETRICIAEQACRKICDRVRDLLAARLQE